MSIKPILFSGPMVRANNAGLKTMTRRVLDPQPELVLGAWYWKSPKYDNGLGCNYFHTRDTRGIMGAWVKAMKYQVGDLLYVRESWETDIAFDDLPPRALPKNAPIKFICDGEIKNGLPFGGRFRQNIFLPRRFTRTTLEVTGVKIEQLQDISLQDAVAEGISIRTSKDIPEGEFYQDYLISDFQELWDSINAEREGGIYAWGKNPWVAAYSYNAIQKNVDQL